MIIRHWIGGESFEGDSIPANHLNSTSLHTVSSILRQIRFLTFDDYRVVGLQGAVAACTKPANFEQIRNLENFVNLDTKRTRFLISNTEIDPDFNNLHGELLVGVEVKGNNIEWKKSLNTKIHSIVSVPTVHHIKSMCFSVLTDIAIGSAPSIQWVLEYSNLSSRMDLMYKRKVEYTSRKNEVKSYLNHKINKNCGYVPFYQFSTTSNFQNEHLTLKNGAQAWHDFIITEFGTKLPDLDFIIQKIPHLRIRNENNKIIEIGGQINIKALKDKLQDRNTGKGPGCYMLLFTGKKTEKQGQQGIYQNVMRSDRWSKKTIAVYNFTTILSNLRLRQQIRALSASGAILPFKFYMDR